MKKIFKYLSIGLVGVSLLIVLVLRVVGVDPQDQRPGLWLAGDVADSPVSDWTFTDEYYEIYLQTNTPLLCLYSIQNSMYTFATRNNNT